MFISVRIENAANTGETYWANTWTDKDKQGNPAPKGGIMYAWCWAVPINEAPWCDLPESMKQSRLAKFKAD